MASVDGITAARAQEIEDASVVSGLVNPLTGHLILTTFGGTDIDAGQVADYAALSTHAALTAAHGATGAVVGTTNTQNLSNKTLVQPTIADFINAQHTHNGTSQGGGLYIGKADSPAPVTALNSVNMSDGDSAKTLASINCPAGRWMIIAVCEGVTLASATSTRFSYNLNTNQPSLIGKPIAKKADTTAISGGAYMIGWLDNTTTATITFTIAKNGTGALITTSAQGALVAVRMG